MDFLRRAIVERRLAPGTRLPTRKKLEEKFGTSHLTVQRAFHQLRAEGLLRVDRPQGAFVAQTLPHLTRYALLLSYEAKDAQGRFTFFYQALSRAAADINAGGQRQLLAFHGRDGALAGEDIRRLAMDVKEHRLAGLIFFGHPAHLTGLPWWKEKNFYHVAITNVTDCPGVIAVMPDMDVWFDRALDDLARRGRRRVSFLTPWPKGLYFEQRLQATLRRHDLHPPPYWFQCTHPLVKMWAKEAAEVLFRLPAKDRPDALVITDDNLVEPATAGVAAAGVRVPKDVAVVAHCNYPVLPQASVPVHWLGFDSHALLERCCEAIDRQRRGEVVSIPVSVAPVFEPELPATSEKRQRKGHC